MLIYMRAYRVANNDIFFFFLSTTSTSGFINRARAIYSLSRVYLFVIRLLHRRLTGDVYTMTKKIFFEVKSLSF